MQSQHPAIDVSRPSSQILRHSSPPLTYSAKSEEEMRVIREDPHDLA